MRVGIADAHTEKLMPLDHFHYLQMRGDGDLLKSPQISECSCSIMQASQGKLADDDRVAQHQVVSKGPCQLEIGVTEVVDPDACIGKSHG